MKKFFNIENPFMIFMSNLTDVIVLNVVCLLCCLPVVTIGAVITSAHYVTLKMVKNEESYVLKDFFKSFRQNFRQSTIIWLLFIAVSVVAFADYWLINGMQLPVFLKIVVTAIYLLLCITMMYSLPLLARFENTVINTIKNAFIMSGLHFFKTILMAVIYALPYLLLPLHYDMIAVFILAGITGPIYINSYLWKSIFKKYEPQEEEETNERAERDTSERETAN